MFLRLLFIGTLTIQLFAQGFGGGLFSSDEVTPEQFILQSLLGGEEQTVKTTVNHPGEPPKVVESASESKSNSTKTEVVDFTLNLSPIEKA